MTVDRVGPYSGGWEVHAGTGPVKIVSDKKPPPVSSKPKHKSHLTKRAADLLMIVVIGMALYLGGILAPMMGGFYSPPASYLSPYRENHVTVYGRVIYDNGTPVSNLTVRVFATDELVEDFSITNAYGYFVSHAKFRSGQLITVSAGGVRLERIEDGVAAPEAFIDYDASTDTDLGTYLLHSP